MRRRYVWLINRSVSHLGYSDSCEPAATVCTTRGGVPIYAVPMSDWGCSCVRRRAFASTLRPC